MIKDAIISTYVLLVKAWQIRYKCLLLIFLSTFIGIIVGIVIPKHHSIESSLLIQTPTNMNPFLHDNYSSKQVDLRNVAINGLLHSYYVLSLIAQDAGLFHPRMDENARDDVIKSLAKNLNAEVVGTDLINLKYTSKSAKNMKEVIQSSSIVFSKYLQPAIEQLGPDIANANRTLNSIDKEIATLTSKLAMLNAKYSPYHSAIKSAKKELQELMTKRDNILFFKPNFLQKQTQLLNSNAQLLANAADNLQLNHPSKVHVKILSMDEMHSLNHPFWQYILLYMFAGLVAGIIFSGGLIVLVETSDNSIRRRDQLEQLTGITVLTRIPRFNS